MPPLAHISSVMATMSRQACSAELQLELVAQVAQHAVQHHAAEQVGRGDVAEQLQAVQPEVEGVAVDERGAEEDAGEHHAVQVEVAQRGPERLRDALLRRERELGVGQRRAHRGLHQPSPAPSRACSSPQYSRPSAWRASARGRCTPQRAQRTRSCCSSGCFCGWSAARDARKRGGSPRPRAPREGSARGACPSRDYLTGNPVLRKAGVGRGDWI